MSRSRLAFIGIIGAAVILVIIGALITSNSNPSPGPAPDTGNGGEVGQPTRPPAEAVRIVVQSHNTKELWMDMMAEAFNAAGQTLESGEPVVVEVIHTGADLNEDENPAAWSPPNQVWVDQVNQEWRDKNNNRPLITESCPSTVSIPIGIAMWQPMAEALGWPDQPISWADITELATNPDGWAAHGNEQWGEFRYGHGHPQFSNSGRLSIVAEIYAATGKQDALTFDDVWSDPATQAVAAVQTAVTHYGRIDTDLLMRMVTRGPQYLHGVTNYESNVIRWNLEYGEEGTNELRFPLVLVYPSDGTFWMDHPFCVLNNVDWFPEDEKDKKLKAAQLFRDFILEEAQQTKLPETGIRPAVKGVPLDAEGSLLTKANGVNPNISQDQVPVLPYPPADVMQSVVEMWYQVKKPSTVLLIIDVSGSMEEDNKIKAAVEGAQDFIRQMQPNDEIIVVTFHDEIDILTPSGKVGEVREDLLPKIDNLFASGGTALYRVTVEGINLIEEMRQEHLTAGEERIYGIVLMTDGENSTDDGFTESQMLNALPGGESSDEVRIYTIAYGEEVGRSADLLQTIATRTNGKAFSGSVNNIKDIYFEISSEF